MDEVPKVKLPNSVHTEVLDISANDFMALQSQGYRSFHGMIKLPISDYSQIFGILCDLSLKKMMVRSLRCYCPVVFVLCRASKSA